MVGYQKYCHREVRLCLQTSASLDRRRTLPSVCVHRVHCNNLDIPTETSCTTHQCFHRRASAHGGTELQSYRTIRSMHAQQWPFCPGLLCHSVHAPAQVSLCKSDICGTGALADTLRSSILLRPLFLLLGALWLRISGLPVSLTAAPPFASCTSQPMQASSSFSTWMDALKSDAANVCATSQALAVVSDALASVGDPTPSPTCCTTTQKALASATSDQSDRQPEAASSPVEAGVLLFSDLCQLFSRGTTSLSGIHPAICGKPIRFLRRTTTGGHEEVRREDGFWGEGRNWHAEAWAPQGCGGENCSRSWCSVAAAHGNLGHRNKLWLVHGRA